MKTRTFRLFFLNILFISVLYGSTFNQLHHFNVNDTRGLEDTKSYLSMANGQYDVNPIHKYRFIIPSMVFSIKNILDINNSCNLFLFYCINFIFTIAAALILNTFLVKNGISEVTAIIGSLLFLTNRVISDVQLPLVDSLYFFGIILIVYLLTIGKYCWIIYLLPFFILFKENLLPITFLLFFKQPILKKRINVYYFLSLALSISIYWLIRHYIDIQTSLASISAQHPHRTLFNILGTQLSFIKIHFFNLFSYSGINDTLNPFELLYLFIILALWQIKQGCYKIDGYLWGLIPIPFFYMLLSGNYGRMIFTAFPLFYLLIAHYIDSTVLGHSKKDLGSYSN